jgi:2-dehydro-3-deoxyphosphogluconate aldolase/(4S)-4-hydroxy-2-oxoglutarate aldolase
MRKKEQILLALLDQKVLPLYYHDDAETSIGVLNALYDAGIRLVEYTNRGEKALVNFVAMKKVMKKKMPGMFLGIGTIKTRKAAKKFIDAGADFIICPTVNKDVAKEVKASGLLWIPGCMTATEISIAEEAGATMVKIFPGNILGPSYISSIRELFPDVRFMPTGGVEVEEKNLKSWFASGVVAVGMGSKLVTKDMMQNKEYDKIKTLASKALHMVREVTG